MKFRWRNKTPQTFFPKCKIRFHQRDGLIRESSGVMRTCLGEIGHPSSDLSFGRSGLE